MADDGGETPKKGGCCSKSPKKKEDMMATGKRSCTDVACCLFFLLFVGGLVAVAYLGLSSGDVSQLRYDGAKVFDPAPILPPFLHQLPVGPTSTDATPGWPAQSVQNAAVAYASSPASHMGNITGPLMLVHGDLDEEVPYQESLSLARALRSRLGPEKLETLFFPGECHGECAYANQLAAHEATAAFLARHLL